MTDIIMGCKIKIIITLECLIKFEINKSLANFA